MNAVGTENFFWGEEYYTGLVKFIPRFLWPDKPLSFDYKLKELANYDFEGGGIYTTLCNDLYINFGYYYFIFYILWLLFIHYLYGMVMDDKRFYYSRIIALFIILMGGIASNNPIKFFLPPHVDANHALCSKMFFYYSNKYTKLM